MVTLREAFNLCKIKDDEVVFLRNSEETSLLTHTPILGRKIRNKYDMRKTMVSDISPHFVCGEYEGFAFTIQSGQN